MSTTDTGGPAFPTHTIAMHEGMTVLDYFAAFAMQSIMEADRYGGLIGVNNYQHRTAKDAYIMAEAMVKEKKARQA